MHWPQLPGSEPVNYTDARPLIKSGDMLLWRDHPGGSVRSIIERWFVRHACASPYTHIGVALVQNGRVSVMDITTKGCAPRPLSGNPDFDWIAGPRVLTQEDIDFAATFWGEMVYDRWQAILGQLKALVIGADMRGQCAEYALMIWRHAGFAPTNTATPAACADGGLMTWKRTMCHVEFHLPIINP